MGKPKKDSRTRNWTFIVYPESAIENWREIIDEYHVPWVESPMHDKDVNPDGEIKKNHWHVMVMFSSNKTYDQIREITMKVRATNPQKVANAKGMVRYFVHMDNPEKFQYLKSDIVAHAGADIESYLAASSSERYELIREMLEFVEQNDIMEMKELLVYAMRERYDDWFPLLCDNSAYIVEMFVKSNRYGKRNLDERNN
ncbi:MAG: replication protein [Enterococcaceae bacterium]|nr:replication protein [Tetragenococcus koreensis]MDN6257960.1 replication protein [Tetragenococcus halophilus]MDN6470347.1 replication protein [Enterococcaceae bacterium]MDN6504521.1 replication protein [Tetragenococcus halophilus]MDN6508768.1 replication protein [Tetragenococcus halophilus]